MPAPKVVRTVVDPAGTVRTLRLADTITHVAFQRGLHDVWAHVSSHRTARAARTYWGAHCGPAGDVVICPVQTAEVTT
jgi:hypothetical protein